MKSDGRVRERMSAAHSATCNRLAARRRLVSRWSREAQNTMAAIAGGHKEYERGEAMHSDGCDTHYHVHGRVLGMGANAHYDFTAYELVSSAWSWVKSPRSEVWRTT